ncbi:MAG TPA: hypothetical protein VJH03_19205 [Blastocatellia bacterium]|nr:hypothetical protein [Blastocatellia bacterium]
MLTAIDAQQPGGGLEVLDQDLGRQRRIGYDNQFSDPDSNDPTTVLGGGSIQIHH